MLIDQIVKRDGSYEARVRDDASSEWEWRPMSADEAEPILAKLETEINGLADRLAAPDCTCAEGWNGPVFGDHARGCAWAEWAEARGELD